MTFQNNCLGTHYKMSCQGHAGPLKRALPMSLGEKESHVLCITRFRCCEMDCSVRSECRVAGDAHGEAE